MFASLILHCVLFFFCISVTVGLIRIGDHQADETHIGDFCWCQSNERKKSVQAKRMKNSFTQPKSKRKKYDFFFHLDFYRKTASVCTSLGIFACQTKYHHQHHDLCERWE